MIQTAELKEELREISLGERFYNGVLELATPDGILASSRKEKYGCVFGRDTAITVLGILNNLDNSPSFVDQKLLLSRAETALLKLVDLQGTETNVESGEQPGKFIHEYREDNFERLIKREKPWFVYPDGKLRNYDSIDSTPLTLIAINRLWKKTGDSEFLLKVLPAVEKGLNWIMTYGDLDSDGLLEFELSPNRVHGGLTSQSWADSAEFYNNKEGKFPKYPIAPVEVQGFAWLALKMWADFYKERNLNFENSQEFGRKLESKAEEMKKRFNETFLIKDNGLTFASQALDGDKNKINTITGNPLLLLWASYKGEAIIETKYIDDLVKRGFMPDLFDLHAGVRTMSTQSPTYNSHADSYHNGSIWPFQNGMILEGLKLWGYEKQAQALEIAIVEPMRHFNSPVELFINNGNGYEVYRNERGDTSCMEQAWTAAYMPWDLLT